MASSGFTSRLIQFGECEEDMSVKAEGMKICVSVLRELCVRVRVKGRVSECKLRR